MKTQVCLYKLFHILIFLIITFYMAYLVITIVDDFDVHVQVEKDFDLNISAEDTVLC